MPLYTLTITSVDRYTAGGSIAVAIVDGGGARFSLAHGIRFQQYRAATIGITEIRLTKDTLTLDRPTDDTTPWDVMVHIEAEHPVIQLRSSKNFSGTVIFLSGLVAASHKDEAGDTSVFSLKLGH